MPPGFHDHLREQGSLGVFAVNEDGDFVSEGG
jgi:hypothetical protein